MGVRVIGDLSNLERKLRQLQRPALQTTGRQVGEALVSSTIRRFNEQRDPEGKPWQPLAAATVLGGLSSKSYTKRGRLRKSAERKLQNRKILIDSARLRNSISSTARGSSVAVGTNVEHARIHQFGGDAGRKTARVNVPARPFLGVSADDRREIRRIVDDAIGGL
jgi:phage virion morphogenesis protein